jgi:CubicO group peptidase (beta-lactamase class C family)
MRAFFAGMLLYSISLFSCHQKEPTQAIDTSLLISRMDSLLSCENREDRFHGTLLIARHDSIIYSKATGVANRNWNIPMEMDYRFDIASLNKSFIAALVLLAAEEGKLKPEDTLHELLQKYKHSSNFDPQITLHHLLTHTSGLPDYNSVAPELALNNFRKFKRMHFSNSAYVHFIGGLSAVAEPGTMFHYSNFGYHLLALLLEDVYQMPFAQLLQEKICQPLQLTQTFASTSNQEVYPKVVEAYTWTEDDEQWHRNNFIDLSLGRRIFSTTPDLHKWSMAMNREGLLSKNSLQLMHTNYLAKLTSDVSYGYGWVVFDGEQPYRMGNLGIDKRCLIHGGSTEGYKAMLVNIERGQYSITLLSNALKQTNEMELTQKIIKLLNLTYDEN